MAINLKIQNNYKLNEHAYIFSSLVYAYLLVEFFNNKIVEVFISKFLPKLFSFSLSINDFSIIGFFYFYSSILFLAFIVESWWGSKREQEGLNSFLSYCVFLLHPLTLYLFLKSFFSNVEFKPEGLFDQTKALQFFFMVFLILAVLIIVRTFFMEKKEINKFYKKEDKVGYVFKLCKEKNRDRIRSMLASIILYMVVYHFWDQLNLRRNILYLYCILLLLATHTLIKHIMDNEDEFNGAIYQKFLKDISHRYLPEAFRGKKSFGILVFNRKRVPDRKINFIVNEIRKSDVYNNEDSLITCCFLTSDNNIHLFEKRLEIWARMIDATIHLANKEIIFGYKEFDSDFDSAMYNYEFQTLLEEIKGKLK